jgi:hypothetical protein
MREPLEAHTTLERAVTAFETTTGLHAEVLPEAGGVGQPDAFLDVFVADHPVRFAAEIQTVDRFQALGAIKAKGDATPFPPVLVAPYITQATAERCRELRLPFMDEAGNAYLEAPGLFVYVTGQRRPIHARPVATYRAFTTAGLKIVFALLNNPDLAAAPYREIAKAARVALGTVGEVLRDLEERGHLAPEKPGLRRLLAPERLREEWATHFPVKLRPKLNARRFTAPDPHWWQDQDVRPHHACWGGEVAAAKLTGHLKPARFTLYVEGKPDRLILANRLRPDPNGEIEILEAFWAVDETQGPTDIAPPLLVYADLMATTDPRNIETAQLIRDRYLA